MRAKLSLLTWDFAVLVLIAFPFFTGGVWIRRPGLFVELSDLGIPVVIVALLGALLKLGFHADLESSRTARIARAAWDSWQRNLENRPRATLFWASLLVALIWTAASLRRYYAFEDFTIDLSYYANPIWNLTHGHGFFSSPLGGRNSLSDHQNPIFWLLIPIYLLFPYTGTLLVIQAFALAFSGAILYALGRQYLPRGYWGLAALPLLYWMYLPIRNANNWDFHPEMLMIPAFWLGILGVQSTRGWTRALGVLSLLIGLGGKESAGPVAVGVSLAWLLGAAPESARSFTRKFAVVFMLLGLGMFFFDIRIVPRILAIPYTYSGEYNWLFTNSPGYVLGKLFGKVRLKYLFWTLAPLGFCTLFNPRTLIAALPGYAMLLLEMSEMRIQITWHHIFDSAIGNFWALPLGLKNFRLPGIGAEKRKALWLLFWALATSGRSEIQRIRSFEIDEHAQWLRTELIPCLDPQASISAPVSLAPHLVTRYWVDLFPGIEMPGGRTVECIIEDLHIRNMNFPPGMPEKLIQSLPALGYKEAMSCGDTFKIYALPGAQCLHCEPRCP